MMNGVELISADLMVAELKAITGGVEKVEIIRDYNLRTHKIEIMINSKENETLIYDSTKHPYPFLYSNNNGLERNSKELWWIMKYIRQYYINRGLLQKSWYGQGE